MAKKLNHSESFVGDDRATYLRSNLDAIQGSAKTCSICSKRFGFLNSESTCMRCNRILCKTCVLDKVKVVFVKGGKIENSKQKICKHCDPDMKSHYQISSQSRGFNSESSISVKWLKALNVISPSASEQESLKKIEELATNYGRINEVQIVQPKDVKYKEFMTSKMNFSYLQHVHDQLGESKIKFDEIQVSISRLINKLAGHYAWKKLPMKIDIIGLFMLTYMSEHVAFVIFTHLLDHLLPPYILQSLFLNSRYSQALSWQQKSVHFAKILSENVKDLTKEKKKEAFGFLEKFGLDMLSSLFINILNLQCFYYSLDSIIMTKKFDFLENALVWILMDNYSILKDLTNETHEKAYAFLAKTIEAETLQSLHDVIQVTATTPAEIKKEDQEIGRARVVSVAYNPVVESSSTSAGFYTEEDHQNKSHSDRQSEVSTAKGSTVSVSHSHQEPQQQHQSQSHNHNDTPTPREEEQEEEHVKRAHKHKNNDQNVPHAEPVQQQAQSIHVYHNVPCGECPEKDRILSELREQNESHASKIAQLTHEIAHQSETLSSQAHSIHESHKKVESLEAEIVELRSSQQPSQLLMKYKSLVATQKEMLEKIVAEKSAIEEKFIQERETAVTESIRDKNLLIEKITQLEAKVVADEAQSNEISVKLNQQLQELSKKNAQLLEDLNSEKLQVAVTIKQKESVEESLRRIHESNSLDAERVAVASDVEKENIRALRETIERLQKELTDSAAHRKEANEKNTEQNNIVYDELREQINCLEAKIKELEDLLKVAQSKHVTDREEHEVQVNSLNKEIEFQKQKVIDEVQRVVEENRIENEQLKSAVATIKQESEEKIEQLRSEKDAKIVALEEEIANLKQKNEQLTQEKGSLAIRVVELNAGLEEKNKVIASNQITLLEIEETHAKLNAKHEDALKLIAELEEKLKNTQEKLEEKQKENIVQQDIIERAQEEREKSEAVQKEQYEKTCEDLSSRIATISDRDAEIERLKALLAKTQKELSAANAELNKYLSIFKSVKQTVDEVETEQS